MTDKVIFVCQKAIIFHEAKPFESLYVDCHRTDVCYWDFKTNFELDFVFQFTMTQIEGEFCLCVWVCVWVCVRMWEREWEWERKRGVRMNELLTTCE